MESIHGFTLLELLVVLTMVGLLTTLAAAQFSGTTSTLKLKEMARGVASELRAARNAAIRTAGAREVYIDTSLKAVTTVPKGAPRQTTDDYGIELRTGSPSAGAMRFLATFYADGSATPRSIVLSDGVRRVQLKIDWLTGRIAVHD